VVNAGQIADEPYRYLLWRRWADADSLLFVMLNPSTADAGRDDPTIRRCRGLAAAWGFGGVEIANLYAFRATDPRDLARARAPVGARNDDVLADAAARAGAIVVAWGIHGEAQRAAAVARLLAPRPLYCLGITRSGAPRHPLYVRRDVCAQRWA
jgi:hypothetical protein